MNATEHKYFSTLAKVLNINKTAEILYISPQALSKRIQNLEKQYGVQLFERKPRLSLTYAGKRLLEYYDKISNLENMAACELKDIAAGEHGILKIGASHTRGDHVFSDTFPMFHEKHPHVTIEVVDGNASEMKRDLLEEKTDMMIAISTVDDPRVKTVEFAMERITLYISEKLLQDYCAENYDELIQAEKSGTPVSLKYFLSCPWITLLPGTRIRSELDFAFSLFGTSPNVIFSANNSHLIGNLIAQDQGAAVFSRCESLNADIMQSSSNMHLFSIIELPRCDSLKVTYLSSHYLPPYAYDLIDILSEEGQDSVSFRQSRRIADPYLL